MLTWNGTVDGKKLRPGRYLLLISAQDAAGNRAKPFPFAVVTIRYLALGRNEISVAPAAPVRALRPDRRQEHQLALRPGPRRAAHAHASPPCSAQARPLQPVRDGGGTYGQGDRDGRMSVRGSAPRRRGRRAGPLGAPRRPGPPVARGGLAGWAVGCALLAGSLAPSGHHRVYAAGAVVGAVASVAIGWLFVRFPWTLPVAVLACVPARIPVTVGGTSYKLLLPLYVVVAGAAVALAVELLAPAWAAHVRAGRMFTPRGRHTGEEQPLEVAPDRERPVLGTSPGRQRSCRLDRGSPCSGRRTVTRAPSTSSSTCSRSG